MTGPLGRRVLRFDSGFAAEGCGIAYGDEFIGCLSAAKTIKPGLGSVGRFIG